MKNLHVDTQGSGPPIVLLHGWGWHSGIWQPIIPYLADKYKLFLVDLPGFGKSPMLPHGNHAEHLFAAIAARVPEQAAWLGWSLGGMLAWWGAIHHPQRISKLITVASSPRFIADQDWPGVTTATLEKFYTSLSTDFRRTLDDFLALQLLGGPKHPEFIAQLKKQLPTMPEASIAVLKNGLKLLSEIDLRPDLKKVTCPSLHLFGQYDSLVPVKIVSLIEDKILTGRCETIPRAGHLPFLTHAELFLSVVENFLEDEDSK